MTSGKPSLHALSRGTPSPTAAGSVPRPPTRWFLRFVLPMVILLLAVAILLYAARDALLPALEVDVVPVVAKAVGMQERTAGNTGIHPVQTREQEPVIVAQAPGWIEPEPFAVTVQALVPGVVQDVLVLEGDRVERGQVVARLIDDDARLALRRAQATLLESKAAIDRAEADLAAAKARLAELDDEINRKRELVDAGGISPGEFARLQHRHRSQQSEVDSARARNRQIEAVVARQQVEVEEAELALERTVIRAPVDGIVLARSAVPGTRIAMAGDGPGEQHFPGIVRLYDPARLQVRADVPLTDSAKVGLGTKARVTTEAMPDRTFTGEVTRIVHLADIQRNTVQVKVRIDDPSPLLKPDMLARVRFLSAERNAEARDPRVGDVTVGGDEGGSLRIFAPKHALLNREGNRAIAWTVSHGRDGRSRYAARREVEVGHDEDEMTLIRSGLRLGDRLIVNHPPSLREGSRVRIRDVQMPAVDTGEKGL